jgi:hypothetical protein
MRTGGMDQVVKCLLASPTPTHKERKKERQKKKIKIGRYIAGDIFFFFYLLSENLDELLLSQCLF